jgi:hypothetical protein
MLDESWSSIARFAWSQGSYSLMRIQFPFFVYTTSTDWLLKRRKNRRRVSESKVKSVEVFVLFSCCFSAFFFFHIFNIKIMATTRTRIQLCEKNWTATGENNKLKPGGEIGEDRGENWDRFGWKGVGGFWSRLGEDWEGSDELCVNLVLEILVQLSFASVLSRIGCGLSFVPWSINC